MVTNLEFPRILQYANSAMALMKKGEIPPYPQFYQLLYTYATGVNPDLNAKINLLFSEADAGGGNLVDRLTSELVRENDVEERLNVVSEQISLNIDEVHETIGVARNSASDYSGSLLDASSLLTQDITESDLQALAVNLLSQTKKMQQTNSILEMKLEKSKENIDNLKVDLEQVRQESMLDPLTRVYNRKGFDISLSRSMLEARETGEALSLVMLDIDHFKRFNDTYGHQTGDQVLRLVALTLKSAISGRDVGARYGGEEFALILPGVSLAQAVDLAEKIRVDIQDKELKKRSTNENLGRVTASFGVAVFKPEDTSVTFIERADQCLYAGKNAGRNCVVDECSPLLKQNAA